MKALELQLDCMYSTFMEKVNLDPLIVTPNDEGLTFFNKDDGAFTLSPPSQGECKLVLQSVHWDDKYDGLVVRTSISYSVALKMKEDYLFGIEKLSLIKNLLLGKAAKHVNLEKCERVSFMRPGKDASFLRELENSAGYEVRLYIQKEK